jgi:hypothetical protein
MAKDSGEMGTGGVIILLLIAAFLLCTLLA